MRISDFILCVHYSCKIVDCNLHIKRVYESIGPAKFLFHTFILIDFTEILYSDRFGHWILNDEIKGKEKNVD